MARQTPEQGHAPRPGEIVVLGEVDEDPPDALDESAPQDIVAAPRVVAEVVGALVLPHDPPLAPDEVARREPAAVGVVDLGVERGLGQARPREENP